VFFFIDLGTRFELTAAAEQLPAAILFSLFVLIGNPIIVLVIMGAMGYPKKVSFKAGLTVAQISEFSLILVALGVAQGHIGDDVVGLVTAVGLITITASTYLIYGSDRIHDRIEPLLRVFERKRPRAGVDVEGGLPEVDVIVIGLGRFGRTVLEELRASGDRVLGVDWDPRSVRADRWGDVPVVYGDADDPELADQLPLAGVQWVISTLRKTDANLTLLGSLRDRGYDGRIVVSTDDEEDEEVLRRAGADLAIRPLHVAAAPLMDLLHDHGRRGTGHDH
jgi:hypothetical protein